MSPEALLEPDSPPMPAQVRAHFEQLPREDEEGPNGPAAGGQLNLATILVDRENLIARTRRMLDELEITTWADVIGRVRWGDLAPYGSLPMLNLREQD